MKKRCRDLKRIKTKLTVAIYKGIGVLSVKSKICKSNKKYKTFRGVKSKMNRVLIRRVQLDPVYARAVSQLPKDPGPCPCVAAI